MLNGACVNVYGNLCFVCGCMEGMCVVFANPEDIVCLYVCILRLGVYVTAGEC